MKTVKSLQLKINLIPRNSSSGLRVRDRVRIENTVAGSCGCNKLIYYIDGSALPGNKTLLKSIRPLHPEPERRIFHM